MAKTRITRNSRNAILPSTSPPDPSNPPQDGKCLWWRLHRDLRAKLLRVAYGRGRNAPVKPIMGVDYLRDEVGFVTTDRRRGKLPRMPAAFIHFTTRFLVSKRWHREATAAFFSASEFDCTHRGRIFHLISPYAGSLGTEINAPLLGLEFLDAIRVRMSELLSYGAQALVTACPQLSRIEIHAEARDLEGCFFEVAAEGEDVMDEAGGDGCKRKADNDNDDAGNDRKLTYFLDDIKDMASTLESRRVANIWKELMTPDFLLTTRWYEEIRHLAGLKDATLMLTQKEGLWEKKHPLIEETNFSLNLWKIRSMLLVSATRKKGEKLEAPPSLIEDRDRFIVEPSMREVGGGEERGSSGLLGLTGTRKIACNPMNVT